MPAVDLRPSLAEMGQTAEWTAKEEHRLQEAVGMYGDGGNSSVAMRTCWGQVSEHVNCSMRIRTGKTPLACRRKYFGWG
eukprot:SAG22_NODE_51_length_24458_cov_19.853161_6_plen_79_part_00